MADDGTASDEDEPFKDPDLAINRVYTRRGDEGTTQLVGGQTVSKTSPRIVAYGTVDELNATVGAARQALMDEHPDRRDFEELGEILLRVQHELFNLGSVLATRPEDVGEEMPRLTETDVEALETEIDRFNEDLPELRSFVLPGGSRVNVELHRARTLCRRAERAAVTVAEQTEVPGTPLAYLNRLGDALFVWSRWAARQASDADEVLWDPNLSSSGSTEDGADS